MWLAGKPVSHKTNLYKVLKLAELGSLVVGIEAGDYRYAKIAAGYQNGVQKVAIYILFAGIADFLEITSGEFCAGDAGGLALKNLVKQEDSCFGEFGGIFEYCAGLLAVLYGNH